MDETSTVPTAPAHLGTTDVDVPLVTESLKVTPDEDPALLAADAAAAIREFLAALDR